MTIECTASLPISKARDLQDFVKTTNARFVYSYISSGIFHYKILFSGENASEEYVNYSEFMNNLDKTYTEKTASKSKLLLNKIRTFFKGIL